VVGLASQFIDGVVPLTQAQFEHKALSQDQCLRILQFSLWRLESLSEWNRDAIETAMQTLAAQLDLKIRDFLFPLFVAISGKAVSTSVMDSLAILGLDLARARLRNALSVLGGVSKKLTKTLDKEYRVLGQAE
jgi:glutamyl-tRNA synthetase